MSVLHALVMAFSLFSTIPMPYITWDEHTMRYMMAAFPAVGVVIGALVWGWHALCAALGFGPMLCGAGYTLIPLAVSGGIHLDGFADVVDAQSSHAEPERKREILKDPHIGAFAAMGVSAYLLAYVALACEVPAEHVMLLACVPVVSRCLSGYATVTFRTASDKGMLAAEHATASARVVRIVLGVVYAAVAGFMLLQELVVAAAMLVSSAVALVLVRRLADKSYGGMSGDLAGYFLQVAELVMLACIVFAGRLV